MSDEFQKLHPEWGFRCVGGEWEDNRKGYFAPTPELQVRLVRQEFIRLLSSPEEIASLKLREEMHRQNIAGEEYFFRNKLTLTARAVYRNIFSDGSSREIVVELPVSDIKEGGQPNPAQIRRNEI